MRQIFLPPHAGDHTSPKPTVRTNGFGPTRNVPTTVAVTGSMRVIVPSPRFGIQTRPSGPTVPSTGCVPTRTVAVTAPVAGSIRETVPSNTFETHRMLPPSPENHTGFEWPMGTRATALVAG